MLTGWDVWGNMHDPHAPPPQPGQWWVASVFDADDRTGNVIATPMRRVGEGTGSISPVAK